MANQYEVLGKAPGAEDLKKLSSENVHLTIKGLSAGYGKMEILHNFDLFVSKAQSLCLIGPNGAGKSTILHSIYGFTNIFSGKIEIDGKEITNLSPAEKLKSEGIAYILQDNSVFPDMTVEENLLMGGYIKDKTEESFEEAFEVEERVSEKSKVPTLFIWGNQDETIGRYAAEQTANQMSGAYTVVELDAGHWLISEQPDLVIEPVISHIRTNDLRRQKDMESLSKAD